MCETEGERTTEEEAAERDEERLNEHVMLPFCRSASCRRRRRRRKKKERRLDPALLERRERPQTGTVKPPFFLTFRSRLPEAEDEATGVITGRPTTKGARAESWQSAAAAEEPTKVGLSLALSLSLSPSLSHDVATPRAAVLLQSLAPASASASASMTGLSVKRMCCVDCASCLLPCLRACLLVEGGGGVPPLHECQWSLKGAEIFTFVGSERTGPRCRRGDRGEELRWREWPKKRRTLLMKRKVEKIVGPTLPALADPELSGRMREYRADWTWAYPSRGACAVLFPFGFSLDHALLFTPLSSLSLSLSLAFASSAPTSKSKG